MPHLLSLPWSRLFLVILLELLFMLFLQVGVCRLTASMPTLPPPPFPFYRHLLVQSLRA